MLINARTRSCTRKILWIGYQLGIIHVLPIFTGVITRASSKAIRNSLPTPRSPFLLGRTLQVQTVDGALLTGSSNQAWMKLTIPKGLPKEGEKALALENEPHFVDDYSGEIREGYGKGTKTLLFSGPTIIKVAGTTSIQKANYHVHDADKAGLHYDFVAAGVKPGTKQFEVNIPRGEYKGRYAFITTSNGMLVTRMKDQGLQLPKPDYTLRKEDILKNIDPSKVIIERKIDGSLFTANFQGQRVAFRSHRPEGETYYDKLPFLEFIKNGSPFLTSRLFYPYPPLDGTVLQGELYHPEGAARVSGTLNSLAPNAQVIQLQRGPIRCFVWDIVKYKGHDVSSKPYEERRKLYEDVVKQIRTVNRNWDTVEQRPNTETPVQFYARVTRDPLPFGEGIVVKPKDSSLQKWDKIKMTGFGYFNLTDILEGEGKYAKTVGRLLVENPENGAKGEVGSLSVPDEFRKWMWNNKSELIGQSVKVRSQEVTSRGVPRAGVFYGFHNGEIDLLMAAEAGAIGSDKTAKGVMYSMKTAAGWRKK